MTDDLHRERSARIRAERQLEDALTLVTALRLQHPGAGAPQQELLTRLVAAWSDLEHLADPARGRSYEAPPGRGTDSSTSDEGANTRRFRAIKAELNRRVRSAIDDAYDRIDGTWEPPPTCPKCDRRQRRSARRCDRCGTPLGQNTTRTSNDAVGARRAPENPPDRSDGAYAAEGKVPEPRP